MGSCLGGIEWVLKLGFAARGSGNESESVWIVSQTRAPAAVSEQQGFRPSKAWFRSRAAGHGLGQKITAEGVETVEWFEAPRALRRHQRADRAYPWNSAATVSRHALCASISLLPPASARPQAAAKHLRSCAAKA